MNWLGEAGYRVNPAKVHCMPKHERQVVTKLVVNEKLRPMPEYIREVKSTVDECLGSGPWFVALARGVRRLKQILSGQVGHIARADPALGKQLRGRLCGVQWRLNIAAAPEVAAST